ncbi:CPBP family intramembrane glutamic endopeptidase [Asticcacaulis endophyticus]|nr:CPBP family intramembrane glutamic endopeptidase [Asticcacaulis endophyticus]
MALSVFVIWLGLTIGLDQILSGGQQMPLSDVVKNGVGISWVLAAVFAVVVGLMADRKAVGFQAPRPLKSLRVIWLPVVYLLVVLAMVMAKGWPPAQVIMFVAINTALVGISEEVMCRGILLRGFLTRLTIWPAIWLSCLAFGLMHVLNVFITGQFIEAVIQATAAFMTGVGYMAVRIRTRSLYPMIIIHALWDFLVFMLATGSPPPDGAAAVSAVFAPVLLTLPMFLYGLFLLRNVHRDFAWMSDVSPKLSGDVS